MGLGEGLDVLIVYHSRDARPRETLTDHLYSFRRYSRARCFYLNAAASVPRYLRRLRPDLAVFHYSFVSDRVVPDHFRRLTEKVAFLRDLDVPKVMIAQDEHVHADLLCSFVNGFGVTKVFSCAQEHEWRRIYRDVDHSRVAFETALTGYVDDRAVAKVRRLSREVPARDIGVGYRSWYPWPSLGRHAQLKGEIGRAFLDADTAGLTLDVSSGHRGGNVHADTLLGDDWYRFLLRCKYTLGVEGGASVLDYDGSIEAATRAYLEAHPDATFEEVEAACFPGRDGGLDYRAISPRHLEACMTRTCQVLIEGEYNGVLQPGSHYIELKSDFSDLADVIEVMRRDESREAIVERAYADIVASGAWGYRRFVESVLAAARGSGAPVRRRPFGGWFDYNRARAREWRLHVQWRARDLARRVIGPARTQAIIDRVRSVARAPAGRRQA